MIAKGATRADLLGQVFGEDKVKLFCAGFLYSEIEVACSYASCQSMTS